MAVEVGRAHFALVEQEQDLAPRGPQTRPTLCAYRSVDGRGVAANIVRGDVSFAREHRTDFSVQGTESSGVEVPRDHSREFELQRVLLGFQQDEQGEVPRMAAGPIADFLQASP